MVSAENCFGCSRIRKADFTLLRCHIVSISQCLSFTLFHNLERRRVIRSFRRLSFSVGLGRPWFFHGQNNTRLQSGATRRKRFVVLAPLDLGALGFAVRGLRALVLRYHFGSISSTPSARLLSRESPRNDVMRIFRAVGLPSAALSEVGLTVARRKAAVGNHAGACGVGKRAVEFCAGWVRWFCVRAT